VIPHPPRVATWLLHRLLDADSREAIAGDLEEEYRRRSARAGRPAAARWYWKESARSVLACRITGKRLAERRRLDFDASTHPTLRDVLRPALRQFRDQPLYALACTGTLALAVGAACASLAVVKRALLDPLPYRDDRALVSLLTLADGATSAVSPHVLEELRASSPPFTGFASIRPSGMAYSTPDGTENILANLVTAEYFSLLGVAPAIGHVWTPQQPNAVIVSWVFWRDKLSGDPNAVGKSITVDGRPRTIVGVMPREFLGPYWSQADLWAPLDMVPLLADLRTRRTLTVLARRAPDASEQEVGAFLSLFSAQLRQKHPVAHGNQSWVAVPLRHELVGSARPALVGTAAAAALLLVIVGANIAGLSTAQAVATRHYLAIRAALGASRRRLFAEQLVDSLVLAVVGSVAGVWIAYGLVAVIARYQQHFLVRLAPIALDGSTMAVGVAAGLVIGLAAALLPRRVVSAARPADSLRARGSSGEISVTAVRAGLVVSQMALALVLLIGAGLLVRTVQHLSQLQLGFDSEGLTALNVNLPGAKYQSRDAQLQFERDVLERAEQIPGVKAAIASVGFPLFGGMMAGLHLETEPADAPRHEVAYLSVSPNFVADVGARIVAGRDLSPSDSSNAPPVVVINETMARLFWPAGDAVGAQVQIGPSSPQERWITVIGVMADMRTHGITEPIRPTAFGSTLQYSWPRRHITVRTRDRRPLSLAMDLRSAIHSVDPAIGIGAIAPIDEIAANSTARHRLVMLALGLFGAIALVLCISGLYAVVALTSRLRRREYAIRLALGARRGGVRWMVVRQALLLAASGAAAGLLTAAIGTRAIQGMLHGVRPLDPTTFAAATVALLALAVVAAWQPARQAENVNPVETLRAE
jgi:putative ABC transport system permease protein